MSCFIFGMGWKFCGLWISQTVHFFLFVYSTYCAITVLFIRWGMHSPVLCEQTDTLVNEWLAG